MIDNNPDSNMEIEKDENVTPSMDVPPSLESAEPNRPEPTIVYQWSYSEQKMHDTKQEERKSRRGILTFAIIMSACFTLTLLVLLASLLIGNLEFLEPNIPDSGILGSGDAQENSPSSPDNDIPYGDGDLSIGSGDGETLSLQQISARGNEVVVAISVETTYGSGAGSGIIMTEDGYIATNHHVIEDATHITVLLYDGREFDATLIGSSEIDDLAVIKIDAQELSVAQFGDSSAAVVGDRAVVIGHPAGLEFGWTSTYGYVSAINRDVKIRDYDGTMTKKMTLLQTDADVNSGNSGGPLFNDRGEVIGIITMKLAGDYEGMGFAIPSNGAVPLLEALMKTGSTDGVESEVSSKRPELGITGVSVEKDVFYVLGTDRIYQLSEEEAAATEGSFRATATGVYITNIIEETDAYDKLCVGDVITAMDGKPMLTTQQIREVLYNKRAGDTVEITLVRGTEQITLTVLLRAAQS